jgi:spermidine synthase
MSTLHKDFVYEDIAVNSDVRNMSVGLYMDERIHSAKGIDIYDSSGFGRCLYLNNALQTSERDEKAYHEPLAHIPLLNCKGASVLIIGGGDGCTLREVLRHNCVKHVTLCEINPTVVEACKEHLPFSKLKESLEDPRVTVVYEDGAKFISSRTGYDVILVDCPDPDLQSWPLYMPNFLRRAAEVLSSNGIFAIQAGNAFIRPAFVKRLGYQLGRFFRGRNYFYVPVPSYPSGGIGFYFASRAAIDIVRSHPFTNWYEKCQYLNYRNFEAGFKLAPKSISVNRRHEALSWYKRNISNWLCAIDTPLISTFLEFDGEERDAARQFGLMNFCHRYVDGKPKPYSFTVFTEDNVEQATAAINKFLPAEAAKFERANGITFFVGGDFAVHVIKKEHEIKDSYRLLYKRKPDACFDEVLLSRHYHEGKRGEDRIMFSDLSRRYHLNEGGDYTETRIRKTGLPQHPYEDERLLSDNGFAFDSFFTYETEVHRTFEVVAKTS